MFKVGLGILLVLAGTLVYLPGLSGPFIFDDFHNIVNNYFVHISKLDFHDLYTAAFSANAGPLRRPVSMLSFALNYYFTGGVDNPIPFKAANIAIHATNGLLAYWLCHQIFLRALSLNRAESALSDARASHLMAGATALIWAVHPIQLTSVLYVVQRMTSLSATFTLLGLIGYVAGRLRIEHGRRHGYTLIISAVLLGGALASLSKEIGLLLPFFVLTIEATIFRTTAPWARWHGLSRDRQVILLAAAILGVLIGTVWAIDYASGVYASRPFTMIERSLTEARVLWLYLSMIIAPGLDRLGLNHDDIEISTSLLSPWTTLPSVVGIGVLIGVALLFRKQYPLLSLGLLWFFVGHALESTIFGLEIAHEHRNYLPSLGIVLACVYPIHMLSVPARRWQPWLIALAVALLFAGVTALRSSQWSSLQDLATFEVQHHPNSPRAQAYLGQASLQLRRFDRAAAAYRRAAELDPSEPAYLMILIQIPSSTGLSPTPEEQAETVRRLAVRKITPGGMLVLRGLNDCIVDRCVYAQKPVEQWIEALLKTDFPGQDNSLYYHILGRSLWGQGRTAEALSALEKSYALDPKYLHPRIDAVRLLLARGQLRKAKQEMMDLITANKSNRFPRDEEVTALSAIFDDLQQRKLLPN